MSEQKSSKTDNSDFFGTKLPKYGIKVGNSIN